MSDQSLVKVRYIGNQKRVTANGINLQKGVELEVTKKTADILVKQKNGEALWELAKKTRAKVEEPETVVQEETN